MIVPPPGLKLLAISATALLLLLALPQIALPSGKDQDKPLAPPYRPRPAHWAQHTGNDPDIEHFFKVDDTLYRGGQAKGDTFAHLRDLGIRTVVDLRGHDVNKGGPARHGMKEIDAGFHAWDMNLTDIVAFLKLMNNPDHHPVFLHCWHGADRTGALVAIYRVAFQGWSKLAALEEMLEGGYGFADYAWMNLADRIWKLDIDQICADAGVTPAKPAGIYPVDPDWRYTLRRQYNDHRGYRSLGKFPHTHRRWGTHLKRRSH